MPHQLLAVGLPQTGKTTFIIALWHTLDSHAVPGSLVLERVEGNLEYLEALRARWLQGLELGRTTTGSEQIVRMLILDRATGLSAELAVPDLAGETYQHHWLDRQWDIAFQEAAAGSEGLLVFVHPLHTFEPVPITDVFVPEVMDILTDGPDREFDVQAASEEDEAPEGVSVWRPEGAPGATQLVEVLQFLERATLRGHGAVPTAVVVSAWDVVERPGQPLVAPEDWVRMRLPLLYQYLLANASIFRTRYYGVSAQGGDLATDRDHMLNFNEPTERIIVADGSGRSHDLTQPIRWLMNPDDDHLVVAKEP